MLNAVSQHNPSLYKVKSAILTYCRDSAFFIIINFVNLAFWNWSSSLKIGSITFIVCEIIMC